MSQDIRQPSADPQNTQKNAAQPCPQRVPLHRRIGRKVQAIPLSTKLVTCIIVLLTIGTIGISFSIRTLVGNYLLQKTDNQLVNQAQRDYVAAYVQASLPQYKSLPVLSVSAPFKSGFQGAADYTDVAVGAMSISSAADLYLYPNTVYAVKVNGGDIKAWLEAAAKRLEKKLGEASVIRRRICIELHEPCVPERIGVARTSSVPVN